MNSLFKLIVLLVICETTVSQLEDPAIAARIKRHTRYRNVSSRTFSNTSKQTNKTVDEKLLDSLFVRNVTWLLTDNDNTTHSVAQRGTSSSPKKTTPYPHVIPQRDNQANIHFPDEADIDPPCKKEGKSFCTDVQNYPAAQLENILKTQISKFNVLFGDEDVQLPINISQRMSPGEESLCSSVERVIYPKAGESKDLKWLYIVNHENYTQAVKIEECVNQDKPCKFADSFPTGYQTKCTQNYIYRQLVAFTKTGEIVKDVFKLPSCCKCIFKQV